MSHTYEDDPEIGVICASIVATEFDADKLSEQVADYVEGPMQGFYLLNVLLHNMAALFKGADEGPMAGHRISVVPHSYSFEEGVATEMDAVTAMVFHCVEHAVNEEWHDYFEHVTMIISTQEMFAEVLSRCVPVYRALVSPNGQATSRLVRAEMKDDGGVEILSDLGPLNPDEVPDSLRDSVFTTSDLTDTIRQAHAQRRAEYEEAERRAKERRGDDR